MLEFFFSDLVFFEFFFLTCLSMFFDFFFLSCLAIFLFGTISRFFFLTCLGIYFFSPRLCLFSDRTRPVVFCPIHRIFTSIVCFILLFSFVPFFPSFGCFIPLF